MSWSVAPLAGAWIEIAYRRGPVSLLLVAPLAGAWIEIGKKSLHAIVRVVAPLAGAWIEIVVDANVPASEVGRSPRGSVD